MAERKKLQEWAKDDGIIILDPDGFDRTDPLLMEREFTREEYDAGIGLCTIGKNINIVRRRVCCICGEEPGSPMITGMGRTACLRCAAKAVDFYFYVVYHIDPPTARVFHGKKD